MQCHARVARAFSLSLSYRSACCAVALGQNGVLVTSSGRSVLFALGVLLHPVTRSVDVAASPERLLPVLSHARCSIVLLSVGFEGSTIDKQRKFR